MGLYSGLILVGLIQSKIGGSNENEDKEEEDKES